MREDVDCAFEAQGRAQKIQAYFICETPYNTHVLSQTDRVQERPCQDQAYLLNVLVEI